MTDAYQDKIIANYPKPTQEQLDQLALALTPEVAKPEPVVLKVAKKVFMPWSRIDELADRLGESFAKVRQDIHRLNKRDQEAA